MFRKPSKSLVGLALLIGATAAVGALSVRLLHHEEARLADATLRALSARAQLLADDLQLSVQVVEEEALSRLAALPENGLREALSKWPETHPLIRNTFIWDLTGRRLLFPDPAAPTTEEERGFVLRYEHLFAARLDALLRAGEKDETAARPLASPRARLQQEARLLGSEGKAPAWRGGWIPWFEGDQLFLLGWVVRGGHVVGAELETAALMARAIQVFPPEAQAGRAWALLDGSGNVVHQSGSWEIPKGAQPVLSVGLGSTLPHWEVAVFLAAPPASGEGGGVRLAFGLVAAALLTSLLAGAGLLLWEAGRRAREARQKTTFVSNVSHELKTPLTTLRLYAELLREGRVTGEDKRMHYLDVMISECTRLGRLVNNMLDFSRLEQCRRRYAVETLELTSWLDAILEPQRLRFSESGMKLNITGPGGPLAVRIDRDALEQALLNLLDNAAKYAASGREVEVALAKQDGAVLLDVQDRGAGVPPELREKIFEEFYRVDASLTTRIPGSGLGLSIARRLLRDLGGDLLCLPRQGGGSCFRIVLRAP